MLGGGGSRCDGSCISGCRAGRSTAGTCRDGKIPPRRLRKFRSQRSPMPPDGGFSQQLTRPQLRPAWHLGCRWRTRSPFFPVSPLLRPSLRRMPPHSRLAEWCSRYSPWTAPDGADGVRIEITGSSHLWGGEIALAADLAARLDRRHIAGRIAIADTLGAAWATARFAEGKSPVILPPGDCRATLAPLPVEALRLDPTTTQGLRRVGLKRVGDLSAMPRNALVSRFGEMVTRRLDQALDDLPEPLSPVGEAPVRRVRLRFAEPIADPADLLRATERLVEDLVPRLAREGIGARRLDLGFHLVDGRVERIRLGTARPSRDPRHLAALFKERLVTVDPGLGIEDVILAVFAVEPLSPEQIGLAGYAPANEASGIAPLLDRLGNRLGLAAMSRLEPRESHIPEHASVWVPVGKTPASSVAPAKAGTQGQPARWPGSL